MGPDLAMRCVPYFKQHWSVISFKIIHSLYNIVCSFWLALISVYFMLGHKEKAIPLLLHLNDISLIDQCSPVWGKYIFNSLLINLRSQSFRYSNILCYFVMCLFNSRIFITAGSNSLIVILLIHAGILLFVGKMCIFFLDI